MVRSAGLVAGRMGREADAKNSGREHSMEMRDGCKWEKIKMRVSRYVVTAAKMAGRYTVKAHGELY